MNFIPDTPKQEKKVPYFEDAREVDGWRGQTTTKSIKRLQAEITDAVSRLGGMVTGFQRGKFEERDGYRITYNLDTGNGFSRGQIDVAALPVRSRWNEQKKDKSLRMALYMLRDALNGTWFLQQLSPGYAPLMPWMLVQDGKTITQLWAESSEMKNLLPPPEEFVDGDVEE